MANNIPDFKTADDLVRNWFTKEAQNFERVADELREAINEWVFSAYLQGHEDGYSQGENDGYEEGRETGSSEGYEEGYDDARSEFDNEW